jgi:GNAT superfamily N-acetyltransferase
MDGVVHGCAALHPSSESSAEIAGMAVDARYAQLGIGAKLLDLLTEKAAEDGIGPIVRPHHPHSRLVFSPGVSGRIPLRSTSRNVGRNTTRNAIPVSW